MSEREPYRLNPVSLRFSDREVESDYQYGYSLTISRSITPLVLMLLPFVVLVFILEVTNAYETPVMWQTAASLAVALGVMWFISAYYHRFIQIGVILVFFTFDAVLLNEITTDAELLRFLPALLMVVILSHCVGISFMISAVTSLALLALQVGYIVMKQLDATIYLDAMTFLVPGFTVAAAAGYTMERQRRHLFMQVRLTRAERDQHELASMHDPLTGLPNRILLAERFEQSVARCLRQKLSFAVMFIDLDDFKKINDSYDHATGDAVLKSVAANLKTCVRGEDTVARLGGDEFVVLSEEVGDAEGAGSAAERLLQALAEPVQWGDVSISVQGSVGVAICPKDGEDFDDLILKADRAMYSAKQQGKGGICIVAA